jgi:hypothetical protein
MKTVKAIFEIEFKGHIYMVSVFKDAIGKTRVQVMVGGMIVKDSTFTFSQTLSCTTAKKILNKYLAGE